MQGNLDIQFPPGGGSGGTPDAHATSHQNGGSDEINVAGLSGLLADDQNPTAHATDHQNNGADEISVAGLSGLLADGQTPLAHATSHQHSGSDEIATATPANNAIPKASGTGKLDSWISTASDSVLGLVQWTTTHIRGLLDSLGTTRGSLIYRGSGGYTALVPSTAGNVLTDNGVGADPSWSAVPNPSTTQQTTTATGNQDDLNLSARRTYLRCNNATALVIRGFQVASTAPQAGDYVIIDNVGSSTVKVAYQDNNSTAAYRIITPSIHGQIVGAGGRMIGVYDDTTDRWRVQCIEPGAVIPITFAAGDWTANGSMTLTVESGDVAWEWYRQRGKTLTLHFGMFGGSVGGTPNTTLRFNIPAPFTFEQTVTQGGVYSDDAGTRTTALAFNTGTGGTNPDTNTKLGFDKLAGGNWTTGTNNTNLAVGVDLLIE